MLGVRGGELKAKVQRGQENPNAALAGYSNDLEHIEEMPPQPICMASRAGPSNGSGWAVVKGTHPLEGTSGQSDP